MARSAAWRDISARAGRYRSFNPTARIPPDMRSTTATLSTNVNTAARGFWLRKLVYASGKVDLCPTKLKPLLPDADRAPCVACEWRLADALKCSTGWLLSGDASA